MRSIKLCHFQWPWTNPNPVFKVRPFFDAKYITNDYRYGHSYYRRRIGNRTQAFKWYNFQWPWSLITHISRSRYYSTSNNSTVYGRSIEWCRFQRPSLTQNLDFKVSFTVDARTSWYEWLVFMQLTRDLFAIAKFLLKLIWVLASLFGTCCVVKATRSLLIFVDIAGRLLIRNLWVESRPCWTRWKRSATTRLSLETSSAQVIDGTATHSVVF